MSLIFVMLVYVGTPMVCQTQNVLLGTVGYGVHSSCAIIDLCRLQLFNSWATRVSALGAECGSVG